jgi:predicted RNA-binding protein (virulence factor B family)
MIKIGQFNRLRVLKEVPFGVYLDGERAGEILLPRKYVPKGAQIGDSVDVFIYFDSEDKIIATTQQPKTKVGCFALLKVIDVNYVGAFLDWGLDKDLLVPRSEQQRPMEKDKSYIIYVTQDQDERIIASSKLDHFLDKSPPQFTHGEEVNLLIAETTPLGNKVIINDSHWGLIHAGEIFQRLRYGERMPGYIKTVREDGKIDVVLKKFGQDRINELTTVILTKLEKEGGFLPLHDKSSSLEIQRAFGESKKSFKNAIGRLYKLGKIDINPDGIRIRSK